MKTIQPLLSEADDLDARAALYYVGRFVKQAGYFERYKKDVFEDEARSVPSAEVKALALQIISALEERESMPAAQFTHSVVMKILREITDVEAKLGPEVSEAESARVEQFLSGLQSPAVKS